jgi:hypothetical protein
VTTVINVPHSLEDKSFEQVLDQVAPLPLDEKIIVDTRHARWASPYGLTALLALAQSRAERPVLRPRGRECQYLLVGDGFLQARGRALRAPGESEEHEGGGDERAARGDLHFQERRRAHVVDKIQQRAQDALVKNLNLDAKITMRFTMALSEVCQNIVEHAGRGGWVAFRPTPGEFASAAARWSSSLSPIPEWFRQSLESAPGFKGRRWDDGQALEETVMRGASRFRDPGRGQGLAGVRRFVGNWDGKLSIRSGTARIAVLPKGDWDEDEPLVEDLSYFPGAQVQITIPEHVA